MAGSGTSKPLFGLRRSPIAAGSLEGALTVSLERQHQSTKAETDHAAGIARTGRRG